jgi:large conductance mechanosensitive channel
MRKLIKEFKEFALGGNLVETAIGLVMALALAALVTSLVENVVMPIVGAIFGAPDFNELWTFTINDSVFRIGSFVTALVTFLSVAFAVYFFVLKPFQAYRARVAEGAEEAPPEPEDIVLLREIRDALAARR